MRYIKKSETEPRDLREYKKNCRKASPPLKITYKDVFYSLLEIKTAYHRKSQYSAILAPAQAAIKSPRK